MSLEQHNSETQDASYNDKVTVIISLCSGGATAVNYCAGALYGWHKLSKLFVKNDFDNVLILRDNILFTASSGGTIPLMLLELCILNNLHNTRDDWFEYYILTTIDKLNTDKLITIITSSVAKSFFIYNNLSNIVVEEIKIFIRNEIENLIPSILLRKQMEFKNPLKALSQFNYNAIYESYNPEYAKINNNFTYLNNLDPLTQITDVLFSCIMPVFVSEQIPGYYTDAGVLNSNDIIQIEKYNNLRDIYYYTLESYDIKTQQNDFTNIFKMSDYTDRIASLYNHNSISGLERAINNGSKILRVKLHLIPVPNKYDPILKYDNNIYKNIVPYLFLSKDFAFVSTFAGIYSGGFRKLLILIGMYETCFVFKDTEIHKMCLSDLDVSYRNALDNAFVEYRNSKNSFLNGLLLILR